jgi:hypothetical protein
MNLDLLKVIDEYKSIDKVQDYLRNDNNTVNDRELLKNSLNDWKNKYNVDFNEYGINERWLILIILLFSFPNEMDLLQDTILYQQINKFMKIINNQDFPDNFGKILITLKLLYDNWKKNDWNINMKLIIGLYLQYEYILTTNIDIDDDLKETWNTYKDELLNMIKEISPGRYQYHIDKYRTTYINNVDNELYKIIKDKVYNEYWLRMKELYKNDDEIIIKNILNDYNQLRNKLIKLMNVEIDELNINEYSDNNLLWVLIRDIKKFDSPYMDKLYDNLYLKWINKNSKIGYIDIIRLLFDRIEIIISLLNKKDE